MSTGLSKTLDAILKNSDSPLSANKMSKGSPSIFSKSAPSTTPPTTLPSVPNDPTTQTTPTIKSGIQFLPKSLIMGDQSTPMEVLQAQPPLEQVLKKEINSSISKELNSFASSSTLSYVFYGGLGLFLVSLIAGLVVLLVILVKNKNKKKKLQNKGVENLVKKVKNKATSEKSDTKNENHHLDVLVKAQPNNEFNEDPLPSTKSVKFKKELKMDDIFPTPGKEEDSEEATFAKQYSYENLQDSMFARQIPKPQRKEQSSFWDSNVQVLKEEIEKSGQTLEQYMANTNAPIPESLLDAWKTPKLPKKLSDSYNSSVPKYAEKEMPSLVVDSTQQIPMDGKAMAHTAMQDILKAKKRAKVLGVKLPEVTKEQRAAILKWMNSDEKEMKDLATSLNTMM